MTGLPFVHDDGGRSRRGSGGDCVTRAIAIAGQRPYDEVYADLKKEAERERPRAGKKRSSVANGVKGPTLRRYLARLGWSWTPTMSIGSGTTVHVRPGEVPATGRLVLQLSGHVCAVIDGVVHDTHDPSRDGTRCVYGYWTVPVVTPPVEGSERLRLKTISIEDLLLKWAATEDPGPARRIVGVSRPGSVRGA